LTRQHLLIDADDTLWENNIYFERAFDDFYNYLAHSSLPPDEVRAILDEIEIANQKIHGYGSRKFALNLRLCYERLCEREISEADVRTVMSFAERILEQPIELMPGIEETLEYLASRHDLTVCTKGAYEEQKLKIDRSGLAIYFGHTAILFEKNAAAYRGLVASRKLDPAITWMIGNSPKSDINAALEAGLNAVFVPHARTWHLEQTELRRDCPGKLIEVGTFADLKKVF
jgi:putative hydrolase of the HAD superfamily